MAMDFLERIDRRYRNDGDHHATADRRGDERRTDADVRPEHVPAVEFGGCWYHEAAVQESQRTAKR